MITINPPSMYCSTSDNVTLKLNKETVKLSKLLQSLLSISSTKNERVKIPFPEKPIQKINVFCEYYISKPFSILPMPLTTKLENIISPWYNSFLNDNTDLKSNLLLIRVAHYLQITELVHLLSAWISSILMEYSPSQIEKLFDLKPIVNMEQCHTTAFYASEIENNCLQNINSNMLDLSGTVINNDSSMEEND